MRRVLVTGAAGFIGRNTLEPLVARGYEVHAVARSRPEGGPCQWHEVDLFDTADVRQLMDRVRPSHLLHLAWYVEHGEFWTSPENLRWVGASLDLLHAFAAAGGARFVGAGTCAEYEWRPETHCVEGETPLRPGTLYGASKHGLNLVASSYAEQQGMSAAWGRLFHLYGPAESPGRLVAFAIRSLLQRTELPCSHGEQRRDFMYVRDAGEAFAALLDGEVAGDVNIATGHPVRVREVVEAIARKLGGDQLLRFGAVATAPEEPRVLTASVARLREEVGWAPKLDLEHGLDETIAWWERRLQAAAGQGEQP